MRPAVISGVSASSFPETAAGNRAYHPGRDGKILNGESAKQWTNYTFSFKGWGGGGGELREVYHGICANRELLN